MFSHPYPYPPNICTHGYGYGFWRVSPQIQIWICNPWIWVYFFFKYYHKFSLFKPFFFLFLSISSFLFSDICHINMCHFKLLMTNAISPPQARPQHPLWSTTTILYHFDQFVSHCDVWRTWQKYVFVRWLRLSWQVQNFVRQSFFFLKISW